MTSSSAPRTNRNCFRPPTGNSSSGSPTRTAIAATARTRWFCPTPNCSNGSRAGDTYRLECDGQPLHFQGQVAALTPHLENGDKELSFTHRVALPGGENHSVADAKFFNHQPPLALVKHVLSAAQRTALAGAAASGRQAVRAGPQIEPPAAAAPAQDAVESRRGLGKLCVAHPATPQFVFELLDETVRLRLLAKSLRDQSVWFWNGQEWVPNEAKNN